MEIWATLIKAVLEILSKGLGFLFVYNKGKESVKNETLEKSNKDAKDSARLRVDLEHSSVDDIDAALSLRKYNRRKK